MEDILKSKAVKNILATGELPTIQAEVSISVNSILIIAIAVLTVGSILIIAKKLL